MTKQIVKDPCLSICILEEDDGNDYCIGCFRTATEIQHWIDFTPSRREEIIAELPEREEKLR